MVSRVSESRQLYSPHGIYLLEYCGRHFIRDAHKRQTVSRWMAQMCCEMFQQQLADHPDESAREREIEKEQTSSEALVTICEGEKERGSSLISSQREGKKNDRRKVAFLCSVTGAVLPDGDTSSSIQQSASLDFNARRV